MFGNDFVFSVSRDFVRRWPLPLYLQPGDDLPHPAAILGGDRPAQSRRGSSLSGTAEQGHPPPIFGISQISLSTLNGAS